MPKSFSKYWYQESAFVKNAFLFHLRDDDLIEDPTARIPQGVIVEGALGYAAAEQTAPGYKARVVRLYGQSSMRVAGAHPRLHGPSRRSGRTTCQERAAALQTTSSPGCPMKPP